MIKITALQYAEADPGGNSAIASIRSVNERLPPQPVKNFAWADGHWAIYPTYDANIRVGLRNLLPKDALCRSQNHKNALVAGSWKNLQRFLRPSSLNKGKEKVKRKRGEGKEGRMVWYTRV